MLSISNAAIKDYLENKYSKSIQLKLYKTSLEYKEDRPNLIIENEDIISESFELEQHLSDGEADYTGCVASTFSIELMNDFIEEYLNAKIVVYITCNNTTLRVFTGYVYDVENDITDPKSKIVCHDAIASVLARTWAGTEVNQTLKTYGSVSLTSLLETVLALTYDVKVSGGYGNCANPNLRIRKSDYFAEEDYSSYCSSFPADMTVLDFVKYFCQINAVFGYINSNGDLEFRAFNKNYRYSGSYPVDSVFYPTTGTYDYLYAPAISYKAERVDKIEESIPEVLVSETNENKWYNYKIKKEFAKDSSVEYEVIESKFAYLTPGTFRSTCTFFDEETKEMRWGEYGEPFDGAIHFTYVNKIKVGDYFEVKIDWIQRVAHIVDGEAVHQATSYKDIAVKVIGNPFAHNKEYSEKVSIATNIYRKVTNNEYHEYELETIGLPFIEVGDYVNTRIRRSRGIFQGENPNIEMKDSDLEKKTCLIIGRTLKGIQNMTDTYTAKSFNKQDYKGINYNTTHYIESMSGSGSPMSDTYQDEYDNEQALEDERNEQNNHDTAEQVDNKIGEGTPWNIVSVETLPSKIEAHTIYLIQGFAWVE